MSDEVLTELHGAVLVITLNRPLVRNAIDGAMADGIATAIEELDTRTDVSVGVITGYGDGFCAGMDLKAFGHRHTSSGSGFARFLRHGTRKPLVAAIEGFAVAGGLEIALTCDIIVAARNAKLGLPEVTRGLLATGGALTRLPERCSYGDAAMLALTGEPITAERAHEVRLVTTLTDPGAALPVSLDLAKRIARNAPTAVTAAKDLMRASYRLTSEEFWEYQAPIAMAVFGSDNAREGALAFIEKREPQWADA